jgi:hypothetical protein
VKKRNLKGIAGELDVSHRLAVGLATGAPDSSNRLAPKIKARVYVAGAVEDAS